VNAWRTPKLVLRADLPDQCPEFYFDSRAPSPRVRFPTPKATKAGPMPMYQRFGPDDRNDLQDQRKPSIHLDEEPASLFVTSQDHQLMSELGILSLKPDLRREG